MAKKRIFIVDNDVNFAAMISLGLKETGLYEVEVENRSTHALKSMHTFMPDVALLDIVMPGKLGTDLAADIKNDPLVGHTAIVFMTSLVQGREIGLGDRLSGFPFIPKPASLEDILKIVQTTLGT